jgi:hypothetical protein
MRLISLIDGSSDASNGWLRMETYRRFPVYCCRRLRMCRREKYRARQPEANDFKLSPSFREDVMPMQNASRQLKVSATA